MDYTFPAMAGWPVLVPATKMAAPLAAVFGGACPELSRRVGIDAAESRENSDLLRSA